MSLWNIEGNAGNSQPPGRFQKFGWQIQENCKLKLNLAHTHIYRCRLTLYIQEHTPSKQNSGERKTVHTGKQRDNDHIKASTGFTDSSCLHPLFLSLSNIIVMSSFCIFFLLFFFPPTFPSCFYFAPTLFSYALLLMVW